MFCLKKCMLQSGKVSLNGKLVNYNNCDFWIAIEKCDRIYLTQEKYEDWI